MQYDHWTEREFEQMERYHIMGEPTPTKVKKRPKGESFLD